MKFKELKGMPAKYGGRSYCTWRVAVGPFHTELFADIALYNAMDENGDVGNRLDDAIAYYVDPDEEVQDAIDEYND